MIVHVLRALQESAIGPIGGIETLKRDDRGLLNPPHNGNEREKPKNPHHAARDDEGATRN